MIKLTGNMSVRLLAGRMKSPVIYLNPANSQSMFESDDDNVRFVFVK